MRVRLVLVAAVSFAAVLAAPPALRAQEAGTIRIDSIGADEYPTVRADVTVPSPLDAGDASDRLRVLEADVPVDARIAQAASADLHVVLLIDTTGSMGGGPIDAAKQAATTFLDRLPQDASVAVVGYDVEASVVTGFDATRDEHDAAIRGLRAAGETAMYDAVVTALDLFATRNATDRQAIVLLTDGEDNASETTLEAAVEALAGSEVVLQGIEYQTAYSDETGVRAFAEISGGAVQSADDPDALVGIYDRLAADLISTYTVTYESEGHGEVEVAVEFDTGDTTMVASEVLQLPEPADATPTQAPPSPASVGPEPPLSGRTALLVGAVAWFGALTLVLASLLAPRRRRAQLAGASRSAQRAAGAHDVTERITGAAARTLERRGYERGLNAALERAGINLRSEEFVVLVASGTVAALVLGAVLSGLLGGILLATTVLIGARILVSVRGDRRQRRFADQLGDTLQLLSGSLRAGYSLMQAVDAVARDADAPTAEEFGRLVVETRLGRGATDALDALAVRLGSDDFAWVVQAIEIHREVGGDLAEVLDNVGNTIRERDQIRRKVRSVSAEGRMSGLVLLCLPFFIGLWMLVTNPSYIGLLFEGPVGWAMLGLCAVLMTAGTFWIRALVRPKF